MKGKLEVYKNYGKPNQELVMEEDNLIVDSAAEILIDLLSTPSSLYSTTLGTDAATQAMFDASNYRIQAISFGKAEPQYHENAHKFKSGNRNLLAMTEYLDNSGISRIQFDRNLLSRNEGEEYYLFRADQDGLIITDGPNSTVSSSPDVSGFQRIPFGNASGALFFTSGVDETSPSAGFWVATDRVFTIASGDASYDGSNTATTVEFSSMPVNQLVPASVRTSLQEGTGFGSGTVSSVLNFDAFHNWYNAGADNVYSVTANAPITIEAMAGSATTAAHGGARTLDPFGTNFANWVHIDADHDDPAFYATQSLSGALDTSGFQVCSVHAKSKTWTLSLYYKTSAVIPSYYTDYSIYGEVNEPVTAQINLGLMCSSFHTEDPDQNLDWSSTNRFAVDQGRWAYYASTPNGTGGPDGGGGIDDDYGQVLTPNASTAPDGTNTAWRFGQYNIAGDPGGANSHAHTWIMRDYESVNGTTTGMGIIGLSGAPIVRDSDTNKFSIAYGGKSGRAYGTSVYIKFDTSANWDSARYSSFDLYNDDFDGMRANVYWNTDGTIKNITQTEPEGEGISGYLDYEDVGDGWYKITLVCPYYQGEGVYKDVLRWRIWPTGAWGGPSRFGSIYIWGGELFEINRQIWNTNRIQPQTAFPEWQPFVINDNRKVNVEKAWNYSPSAPNITLSEPPINTFVYDMPISQGSGTPGEWKRAEAQFHFSSCPSLFIPRLSFGFIKEGQGLWISHMQLEPGTSASPWQDGSSLSIMKGLDRESKDILKKPFTEFSNRNKPADNKPLLMGEGTLDSELCYSVYINPGGLKASNDADSIIRLKLVDGSGGPGYPPYTDTVLSPGTDAWTRVSHKTIFSGTNSDRIGVEMFLSGINPGTDFKLSNPQLEYTSFTLPENYSEINTGLPTPTDWIPRLLTSSVDVWNGENYKDNVAYECSVIPNVVAGPFPGTSGNLVFNPLAGKPYSLQQRLHTNEHAPWSVNNYSSVAWYNKPITASVYLKYNFEDPVGQSPDGEGDADWARRSEIAIYPADDGHGSESRYAWGSELVIRWSPVWKSTGGTPDPFGSPGDGSAAIDDMCYVGDGGSARCEGELEYINNGWYRASVTMGNQRLSVADTSALVFSIYPKWRRENGMPVLSNTSGSLYVYGPQLEIGDHPTEYQKSNAFFSTATPYTFSAVDPEKDFPVRQRHDTDFSGTIDSSTLYLEYPYPEANVTWEGSGASVGANLIKDSNYFSGTGGDNEWVATTGKIQAVQNTSIYPLGVPSIYDGSNVNSSWKMTKLGTGYGGLSQFLEPSSLEHGKNYTVSWYWRRISNSVPDDGIRVKLLQRTGRKQIQGKFLWTTSGFSLTSESTKDNVFGYVSVEDLGEGAGAGTGVEAHNWFKCSMTMPFDRYDTTGPNATLGLAMVLPTDYGAQEVCYLSQVTCQLADVSSYTPQPYLPKTPNPRDVSIVEKYRPPMASALEFSSTFNQNVNFLAFRDNSALNVSSFKSVEIVPHRPQYTPGEDGPEGDTSGALGANALYFGCYPPASTLVPGTGPDPADEGAWTPRNSTNINYVIVSSFESSDAYLNPTVTGTYVGYFNQTSSMDPSGFVRAYQASDVMAGTKTYASGLIVSSEPTFSSTGEVIYMTQIAAGDLGMANLYGGITQLGLWSYDMKQMVAEGKYPPYNFVPKDIDDPHNSSLLGDSLKYKLVCKKVLSSNLGGILDSSGPGAYNYQDLTLVWRLNFTDTQ